MKIRRFPGGFPPGPAFALALVAVAVLAGALLALNPTGAAAAANVSGIYQGEQDGQPFRLVLRQDGALLSGAITFDEIHEEPMTGALSAGTVILVRQSSPIEIWLGSPTDAGLAGRWFSAVGQGVWSARQAGTHLRLTKSVAPDLIRSGVETPVAYELVVANGGRTAALDVHLQDDDLPDFYHVRAITIRKSWDAAPDQPPTDALTRGDGLALGTIPVNGLVVVTIHGIAAPREPGLHTNTAVAGGSNAPRVHARAQLAVAGAGRLANAFQPAVIAEGSGGGVQYTITLSAPAGDGAVIVTDETIEELLRGATVEVRGARGEGSLARGLTISQAEPGQLLAQVIVTGHAGHLEQGRYASTALLSAGSADPIVRSTATLGVALRCNDDHARDERPDRACDRPCDERDEIDDRACHRDRPCDERDEIDDRACHRDRPCDERDEIDDRACHRDRPCDERDERDGRDCHSDDARDDEQDDDRNDAPPVSLPSLLNAIEALQASVQASDVPGQASLVQQLNAVSAALRNGNYAGARQGMSTVLGALQASTSGRDAPAALALIAQAGQILERIAALG